MFENLSQIELIFAVFAAVAVVSAATIYFVSHKFGRFFAEKRGKRPVNQRDQNSSIFPKKSGDRLKYKRNLKTHVCNNKSKFGIQ